MHKFNPKNYQQGLTLIELMVALAISSLLLLGLATVFFNSSRSYRELDRAGQMLENGRYALTLLSEDLRHAGFYGEFFNIAFTTLSYDPCYSGNDDNVYEDTMKRPLQGYNAATIADTPDITTTSCGGLLPDPANLSAGSDILVLRRAATTLSTGSAATDDIYLQTNGRQYAIHIGTSGATLPPAGILKYPDSAAHTESANTRKYDVHVYFVAPCSIGNDDGVCDGTEDEIYLVPTLKRLELTSDGTNTKMEIVPLVEGIEYFQVEYGVDDTPNTINTTTNNYGDGLPDLYVSAPTAAQWPHVITVRIYLLARTIEPADTRENFVDDKIYQLAGVNFDPPDKRFKRHVYGTEVRPINLAGRREIPK